MTTTYLAIENRSLGNYCLPPLWWGHFCHTSTLSIFTSLGEVDQWWSTKCLYWHNIHIWAVIWSFVYSLIRSGWVWISHSIGTPRWPKNIFSLKDELDRYHCAGGLDTWKILDLTRCDLILRLLNLGGGAELLDCLGPWGRQLENRDRRTVRGIWWGPAKESYGIKDGDPACWQIVRATLRIVCHLHHPKRPNLVSLDLLTTTSSNLCLFSPPTASCKNTLST